MDSLNIIRSYEVSDTTWNSDWRKIQKDFPYLTDWGIQIFHALKGSAQSLLVEPYYVCKDHRDLFRNYYSKKHQEVSPNTNRFHFFSKSKINVEDILLNSKEYKEDYIGYSVIRPVAKRCIGRTVIDPYKINTINKDIFYCLRTTFRPHIAGWPFEVRGYPYTSQDTDATVCAHASLWGVCRYLSERYSLYGEAYPFDIIELTGASAGRTFPYRGMTYSDYCEILSSFGTYPIILRLKTDRESNIFDKDEYYNLCTYVESGFPTLASFQRHVVTLIGHTIDYNKVAKPDRYGFIDSTEFLKQFIVVDDNFFPYQLLGEEQDNDNYGAVYNPAFNIRSIVNAVCPLPEKVFLTANRAKRNALRYFRAYRSELGQIKSGPYVTRLFLTNSTPYKRRKIQAFLVNNSADNLNYLISQLRLPHFIWVMELSTIKLYQQGQCISEIILDSTAGAAEDASIFMRIGNKGILEGHQFILQDCPKEFKQYTHNLGER